MMSIGWARAALTTARLMRSQWWPRDRIQAYQRERLASVLRHAREHVPYYRERWRAAGVNPTVKNFAALPTLSKADMQEHSVRLLAEGLDPARLFSSRTSGSTGEPTTTYFDRDAWVTSKFALKARRMLNAVSPFRQRVMIVSEQADFAAAESLSRLIGFNRVVRIARVPIEREIKRNLVQIQDFLPTIAYGFPSYFSQLIGAAERTGMELPRIPVMFTSSEVLTDSQRSGLETHFGGKVYDVYGSTEFKEIAVQCRAGRYHINFETVLVECIDDNASSHDDGRLLITSLVNRAMPMIRYEIGDRGRLEDGDCRCGRSGPTISRITGRHSDILEFPDGTTVSPFILTTIIGSLGSVRNYQIVHAAPWELRIAVLAMPRLSVADERLLRTHLAQHLPQQVSIVFEALDERLPPRKRISVVKEF